MPRLNVLSSLAALGVAAQFFSGVASAHIDLTSPMPRYPNATSGENKACPCGVGTSNRTCSVPSERSDPNRASDRVTTLTAGQSLTVRFDEYIGHSGRYRVALDLDGADLEDFNANVLEDIVDPNGNTGNVGEGSIWEIEVTVPNTPCENCTLQLIQMMDGNMSAPVADPVGRSSYYQCADIRIVAAGNEGGAGGSGGLGGSGGAAGTVAAPDAGGGAAGASSEPGDTDPDVSSADEDDGGCSIERSGQRRAGTAIAALSAFVLAAWSRRRRTAHGSR